MNIKEEEEIGLSLRKHHKKNKSKNIINHQLFSFNEEDNDNTDLTKRKRTRQEDLNFAKLIDLKEPENKTCEEDKLFFNLKEIWNKLHLKHSNQNNDENDYDIKEEKRRKNLVNDLINDTESINYQIKTAINTKNQYIFCLICDNFNTYCSLNNNFLIKCLEFLDKLLLKSFEFDDYKESISFIINLCYLIFEYKFFDNKIKQKYINIYIEILIDENKIKKLDEIPDAKIYLFSIVYSLFYSLDNDIKINEEKIISLIKYIYLEINENNNKDCNFEILELLLKILDVLCTNENFISIYKYNKNKIYILKDINIQMYHILTKIINNLKLDERQNIITDDDINFIVRYSINIIIKNMIEINIIYLNNDNVQKLIITNDIYNLIYGFIIGMSNLNLDEKNYCWLIGLMENLIKIPYYQSIFSNNDYQVIILNKFRYLFPNKISYYLKLIGEIINIDEVFKKYLNNSDFIKLLEGDDDLTSNDSGCYEYLRNVLYLIKKNIKNNDNYFKNKYILIKDKIKQRIELIFDKTKNNKIKNICEDILEKL